jgi:hypothetical protein
MWFLHRMDLVTKDNLAKRNCHGNMKCCFYDKEELIQHVFIDCMVLKNLWRILPPFRFKGPTRIPRLSI